MSVVYFTDRDLGLQYAKSFVATRRGIEAFLQKPEPPFIAKVYRASPAELAKTPSAPGHILLWVNA